MKAKEAAEIIKGIEEVRGSLPEDGLLVEEALNMAIKALELFGISEQLPSAQPEYEPVTAEDFAKTMSENTLYSFMAWYGEALELMKRQGFVICKKTM